MHHHPQSPPTSFGERGEKRRRKARAELARKPHANPTSSTAPKRLPPSRAMRSFVPPPSDGADSSADGDDPSASLSSLYWWRSLVEFNAGGSGLFPSSPAAPRLSTLTPRLRVIKELERLALVSHESLDDLRHKLLSYRSGDLWFPAGGIPKQDTDIPPVITVLLLGFGSSGKSSLVNLMYSVLGRAGFVPFAHTSSPAGKDGRTMFLEEHNVLRSMRNGFCVFDSRGLDYARAADGMEEVAEWMEDGVRHRQVCRGAGIPEPPPGGAASAAAKRFVRRRVNCAMVVVSFSEMYSALKAGDTAPIEATKQLFHANSIKSCCNENPILVLTHGDELSPEERIEARVMICDYLGVSESTGVYDIACLNEQGVLVDEMDPVTAYALAEAVYRALLVSDRCHPPKPGMRDWLLLGLSWAMVVLSSFFAFLSCFCSKVAKANRDHKKLRLD